ncbi:jerky protein homolog [Bombina bombina]|uniref:jerky protein homolog n=1 Tax=Bombina bombina TaxID=8345 RepID=UPI00235A6B43|nr:jerky protein homolog [Bombina bombina]
MSPKVDKQKRRRNTLKLSDKLEIIKKLESGVSVSVLMETYDIGKSTIYDIKNAKNKILQFTASSEPYNKIAERKSLHKPKLENLDKVLHEWFLIKRSEGMAISGPMLITKAKSFKEQMNIDSECNFSSGWLRNFKMRHGIRQLNVVGERQSADTHAAADYSATFEKIVIDYDLTPDQIYNADETGVFWKCLPTKTLAGNQERNAKGFKMNKERLTVLTCANASGQHKIKLLVIGKYKRPRAFKGILHLPVTYKAQKNAWMDKDIFQDWFVNDFIPSVRQNLTNLGKPANTKCLLLLDNCRAHPHESKLVSDCGNIFASYLPPNVTSLIQPMDQGVIRNFKCHYKNDFMMKMLNKDVDSIEFQRSFTIKDAVLSLVTAWNTVKPVTLLRAWRKLWPNVMHGELECEENEDLEGFLVEQRASEVNELMQSVKLAQEDNPLCKLNEEDLEEWICIEDDVEIAATFTDQEIIDSITNPDQTEEHTSEKSDEEDDRLETEKVSWATAEKCMETIVKFVEQNHSFTLQDVMQVHMVQNNFITKKLQSRRQCDIRRYLQKTTEASAIQTTNQLQQQTLTTLNPQTDHLAQQEEENMSYAEETSANSHPASQKLSSQADHQV